MASFHFFKRDFGSGVLQVAVFVSVALLLSGCTNTAGLEKMRPPSLPKKAPPLKAGELPKITVIPGGPELYWNEAKRGAEAAGKKFGARVEWKVPVGDDLAASQKKLIESAAKDSHGLVVAPCDPTKMMQPVGDAARAGLAVVVFDRDVFTAQNKLSFVHNDEAQNEVLRQTAQKEKRMIVFAPDYYQMGFRSVQSILDYRALKPPPREIKIAPRILTKNLIQTNNRSTP